MGNKSENWDYTLGRWYWDNGLAYPQATYFSIKLHEKEIKLYYEEYLLVDFVNKKNNFSQNKEDYWPIETSDELYKNHREDWLKEYVESKCPFTNFSDYCFKMHKTTVMENIGRLLFANATLNNMLPEELLRLFKK